MSVLDNPVHRAFDRAAQSYDRTAELQREVARRLVTRLPAGFLGRTLDVGCGTGYGGSLLRERLAGASLLEMDISPAMLSLARQKGGQGWLGICGDLEKLPLAEGSVNLLWSSLALQWAARLGPTLAGFHRCLAPHGLLQFSTLGPGTLWELADSFSAVDGYRHVNRFIPLEDIRRHLLNAGFVHVVLEEESLVMEYDDLAGVLRGLKDIGAKRVVAEGVPGLMGKGCWRQAVANYESLRRAGRLPATYQVIYGSARKPVPA